MSSRKWVSFVGRITPIILLLAACSDEEGKGGDNWTGVCIDADGDGYGLQCESGDDCNDADPMIHTGCAACARPSEGCDCIEGSAPIACADTPEVTSSGTLICKGGTRYCRDGTWTACEGISSFTAPPPSKLLAGKTQGLILGDARRCNECNPDCYEVEDPIDISGGDGGMTLGDATIAYTGNGGITLNGKGNMDAGGARDADVPTPIPPCNTATDSDCDGIPNMLDPYPFAKPFESTLSTIFFDLAPGQTKSNTFDLKFYLRTADIYFLLDMTGSMNEEQARLLSSLKTGNFLDNPDTAANESLDVECADRDFNGSPDNYLKDAGVAGNIACLIRSSAFGAGWYREIPFSADDDYSVRYSYPNFEPFEHRLDITESVDSLNTELNKFVTRGNQNWAEAATPALSLLATGGPLYFGWDRPGVPQKTCTTAGRYGYPCFRADAVPIIINITDAPMMNGPTPAQGHLGDESQSTYLKSYYSAGKQPVNYLPKGLNYLSKSSDGLYHPVKGNETLATAYDVGAIDSSFKTYTGDTRGMTADLHPGNLPMACPVAGAWPSTSTSAAAPGYPDAVFKFKVSDSTKPLTISTRGTHHKPTLAIIPIGGTPAIAAGTNPAIGSVKDLGALSAGSGFYVTGDTSLSGFATGELTREMISECARGDTSMTSTAPDAWFKFTTGASDINNVEFSATGSDFQAVLGLWSTLPTAVTATSFYNRENDKIRQTDSALPGGTPGVIDGKSHWLYYGSTDKSGIVYDYPSSLFTAGGASCGNVANNRYDGVVDFTVSTARMVRIETTAWDSVVSNANFDHVIGLFTRPASGSLASGNVLSCNRNALATNRAYIERMLNPGTYSVVVRGERQNADRGEYGLLISDANVRPLGCHNEATSSSFTANLKANTTYYLGMRGRTTSSGGGDGPYTLRVGTPRTALCAYDNATYTAKTDDNAMNLGTAEVANVRLGVGEYYAIIKGNGDFVTAKAGDQGRGWYQITFGDQSLATTQTAVVPQWGDQTSGIQKELVDRGIRVINVTSTLPATCGGSTCSGGADNANIALRDQADQISTATGAVGIGDVPLRFDISNNGNGMGFAVVDAIARLSNNVAMDVSARLVQLPDTPPAPGFLFVSRAIDTPGDSCTGPIDTDSDGVLDTHTKCRPGAVPRFEVKFTNPLNPAVPPNPAPGSNGGYNMKVELVGDNKFVIDSIPVFIIPEEVISGNDDPFQYAQTGTYAQDISAQCTDTDRPLWQSLAWTDSLPAGTSLQWNLCLGDSTPELDACEASAAWTTVVGVTPGGSCTSSSQCLNGYCSSGTCRQPVAPANTCSVDTDCGTNGVCVNSACAWTANPISLLPTLRRGLNGKSKVRVQLKLNANSDRTLAPSVQDFRVIYTCAPGV